MILSKPFELVNVIKQIAPIYFAQVDSSGHSHLLWGDLDKRFRGPILRYQYDCDNPINIHLDVGCLGGPIGLTLGENDVPIIAFGLFASYEEIRSLVTTNVIGEPHFAETQYLILANVSNSDIIYVCAIQLVQISWNVHIFGSSHTSCDLLVCTSRESVRHIRLRDESYEETLVSESGTTFPGRSVVTDKNERLHLILGSEELLHYYCNDGISWYAKKRNVGYTFRFVSMASDRQGRIALLHKAVHDDWPTMSYLLDHETTRVPLHLPSDFYCDIANNSDGKWLVSYGSLASNEIGLAQLGADFTINKRVSMPLLYNGSIFGTPKSGGLGWPSFQKSSMYLYDRNQCAVIYDVYDSVKDGVSIRRMNAVLD